MKIIDCRHFSGYKPCGKSDTCDNGCPHIDIPQTKIVIVHLEALGAVLRATSLLPAIKRKYPSSHITWVTKGVASRLLENNPLIDQVEKASIETYISLQTQRFDVGFCVDKSKEAWGYMKPLKITQVYGFRIEEKSGAIVPSTVHAQELWNIGLSDSLKFYENKKPETQLIAEAMALPYARDEYVLKLNSMEKELSHKRRSHWKKDSQTILVGLNTGCAPTIPYKKLTVEFQAQIAREVNQLDNCQVVLLGGPEDTERNLAIKALAPNSILSETQSGVRDGLASVDACDIVVTGDSLGMHMAIALKKWTVAWFGPTCAHEIDLFGRGEAILTQASCSPCWKRTCQKPIMCYDQVSIDEILNSITKGMAWHTSLYKQPLLETCF